MTSDVARLAAAFFVPRERGDHTDDQLIAAAGFDTARARWAELNGCRCRVDVRTRHHQLVFIDFWASSFLERLPDETRPVQRDGAIVVARAFRDACLGLSAPAAFIATHRDQASTRYALSLEWMVLALDGDALLGERLGLTWLAPELSVQSHSLEGRDQLPIEGGHLVFADQGEMRWF